MLLCAFPAAPSLSLSVGIKEWSLAPHEISLHPRDAHEIGTSPFGYVVVESAVDSDDHHIICRVVFDEALLPGEVHLPSWILALFRRRPGVSVEVHPATAPEAAEIPLAAQARVRILSSIGRDSHQEAEGHTSTKREVPHHPNLARAFARRAAGCLVRAGTTLCTEILGISVVAEVVAVGRATTGTSSADGSDVRVGNAAGGLVLHLLTTHTVFKVVEAQDCAPSSGLDSQSCRRQEPLGHREHVPHETTEVRRKRSRGREGRPPFNLQCRGKEEIWTARSAGLETWLDELHSIVLLSLAGGNVERGRPNAHEHVYESRQPPAGKANLPADSKPRHSRSADLADLAPEGDASDDRRRLRVSDVLPTGIALCGPSGIGKTLMLDILSEDLDRRHGIHVRRLLGPQILNSVGVFGSNDGLEGTGGAMHGVLDEALVEARLRAPAVIVIDELDAILDAVGPEKNSQLVEGARAHVALLSFLDAVAEMKGVFVIGATRCSPASRAGAAWAASDDDTRSTKGMLPMAFQKPGRLERCIEVTPPTQAHREGILTVLLRASGWRLLPVAEHMRTGDVAGVDSSSGGGSSGDFQAGTGAVNATSAEGGVHDRYKAKSTDQGGVAADWARRLSSLTPGMVGGDLKCLLRNAQGRASRRWHHQGRDGTEDLGVDMPPLSTPSGFGEKVLSWRDMMTAVALTAPRVLQAADSAPTATDAQTAATRPTWASIGGYSGAKRRLQMLVQWPWLHPEAFARMGIGAPTGALLYGPSGCGKSLVAQVLATECLANFVWVRSTDLLSRYLGETEAKLRALFARARAASPCILFLDELDAVTAKRGEDDGQGGSAGGDRLNARILSTLLNEMDGVSGSTQARSTATGGRGVLVLAATNRVDSLDAALLRPGRLHEAVEIGMPLARDREGVLRVHAGRMPLAPGVDLQNLSRDDVSGGLSCADLQAACRDAALMAIRQDVQGARQVQPEQLQKALEDRVAGRLKTRRFTFSVGQ